LVGEEGGKTRRISIMDPAAARGKMWLAGCLAGGLARRVVTPNGAAGKPAGETFRSF
jgi:hypothetical protein